MADPALKRRRSPCEFFVAPGVFDMMTMLIAGEVSLHAVRALGCRWEHCLTPTIDGCAPATLHHIRRRSSRVADPRGVVVSPVLASEPGTRFAQPVGSVG